MLPLGAMPRLPEMAEPMSVRMSPNRFGTQDRVKGLRMRDHPRRKCVDVILAVADAGKSFDTCSTTSSHSIIECWSAFDLVALARSLRGRDAAIAKPVARDTLDASAGEDAGLLGDLV